MSAKGCFTSAKGFLPSATGVVRSVVWMMFAGMFSVCVAHAGGPRFVTNTAASNYGLPMGWWTSNISYFTDPGDLSANMAHAKADAVVAAAAAVWNVPTASIVLSQGGALSEHVSGGNTYFDGDGVVFPADVQATNYQAKPIAVIYDRDGSVTDLLLGEGASDPSSCRQNEVTESVDGFGPTTIQHAVLVVNGRCIGTGNDDVLQLQYDLVRAFGRVLGLGWTQLNDNVFTGAPTPTADQMSMWPVMHPIDVLCGPYTYLCMVNPFTLRLDDLNALATLYPVTASNVTPGKTLSLEGALEIDGSVQFPGWLGMDGVNVVATRYLAGSQPEPWQAVSAITGVGSWKNGGNPVTGPSSAQDNVGAPNQQVAMRFVIAREPLTANFMTILTLENVNPLYTGAYSIGPFQRPPVTLSGTPERQAVWTTVAQGPAFQGVIQQDAPTACFDPLTGYESQPRGLDPSGFWSSNICSIGGNVWRTMTARAGRTWTIEITAQDESGGRTTSKLQPVIGVWNASDATGQLPTVAAQPIPMNTVVPGLTQLTVPAGSSDGDYRFTLADYYQGGRPDFAFSARVLYADTVAPATVTASGGQITINGMGFANGNRVLVNGVVAKVISWSATQIVAVAPTLTAAKASGGIPVDVTVQDLTTGGTTNMTGVLTYPGGGTRGLAQVSAPSVLETGVTAATPFAVKVLASDGVTAVPGGSVRFSVVSGGGALTACGLAASCTLTANASGVVQTTVTGTSPGSVTLAATEVSGGATVQITVADSDPQRAATLPTPTAYVAAGAAVTLPVVMNVLQDGAPAAAVPVAWSAGAGLSVSAAASASDSNGAAGVQVSANAPAPGSYAVQACAWSTLCAGWTMVSVDASQWTPAVVAGAGQSVAASSSLAPVVVRVTDAAGHALLGATVTVSQTVTGWEGTCPPTGRCPAAPLLGKIQSSALTDSTGLVTISPLQVSGVAQVVNLAVSSGSSGFVTLTLVKTP